ncbi:hypothetical protein [Rhodococcus sp. IEGM 1379]|uniref:hypothetical protein n=1 Tax=Rhodococcus sp. IEGM 1379 TaxID=3047086 RepID=UPI0024B797A0|nr:hypothetical protein [Rhodococcus sp. IEGM 1379]MDI9918368.1 hypothetical protein [Rhodococcus sp. IEGM 1379]
MIESAVYVYLGSVVAFQQTNIEFEDFPGWSTDMMIWDPDQRMLVITTGATRGAVHFRSEIYSEDPPMEEAGWDSMQEVSVRFDTGDVRLVDVEFMQTETFPAESLISHPGGYRIRLYETGRESPVEMQKPEDQLAERYLMQIWPDSIERPPTQVVRLRG